MEDHSGEDVASLEAGIVRHLLATRRMSCFLRAQSGLGVALGTPDMDGFAYCEANALLQADYSLIRLLEDNSPGRFIVAAVAWSYTLPL